MKRTALIKVKLILLIVNFILSINSIHGQCSVEIPQNILTGTIDLGGSGSNTRHVNYKDTLKSNGGGSNVVYVESGGFAHIRGGGSNIIYVKKYGKLIISGGGGSNTIYYDSLAIIIDSLSGGGSNNFIKCKNLQFNYYKNWSPEYSLKLDGQDDKISVPNPLSSHDSLTITVWAKLQRSQSNRVLIEDWSNSDSNFRINQVYKNGIDLFMVQLRSSNSSTTFTNFTIPIDTSLYNNWISYAITLNPNYLSVWVNGQKVGTITNTVGSMIKGSNFLNIGAGENFSFPFNGSISEIGLFNKELNQTELLEITNKRINSNKKSIIALYRFNDGTGNYSVDSINNLQLSLLNSPQWVFDSPYKSNSVKFSNNTTISQDAIFDSISIINGANIKLSAHLTCKNIYLKNGTIDLNGHRLTVTGKVNQSIDSNNYYIQAGTSASPKPRSELVISSSTAQNSTVYFNPNANRINRFEIGNGSATNSITLGNSLKIKGGEDGGSGPGLLTIKKNSKVIIPSGSILTLESDTFNAGLSLSDPAKRAIICQGTGKFAIEREHFGARGWRLYSHPFNANIDLQQVADDIEVIGSGGTSEEFFSNTYTNSSVYWYDYSKADSTVTTDPAWTAFTSAKGTTISGNTNLWNKTSPILLFNPGAVRGSGAFSSPSSANYQVGKITLTYGLDSISVHLNDGETKQISSNVPDYIPFNGLVAYWPFNGNANDESGNGNHGTVNGASLTSDRNGTSNSAYDFDGQNDKITVPWNAKFQSHDLTISTWVMSKNTGSDFECIIKKGNWQTAVNESYSLGLYSPDWVYGGLKGKNCNPGAGWTTYSYNHSFYNTWNHLMITFKKDTLKIYINGSLKQSEKVDAFLDFCSGGDITIGEHWDQFRDNFTGKLDDIAIWNRALTSAEISALYNGTATTKLSSKSQYYFITNPFTTPVKLNRISGLNSTNCHSYFYYWKQRRNAISNNFMPAMWQSELISNGNTDRDTNISIPAFGTILVKLKNPSVAFSIPESAKQLTNFNYIIGGAKGTSSQGLMFQEIPLPKQGPGAVEIELLINDSLPVDRLLIYDKPNEINTFGGADAPKYKDPSFANIYSITTDGKALSLDAQDITARLNSGEEQVEIPLVIDRDFNKTQKNLRLRIWEKHTDLQCYFKDSKSGNLTPAESFDDIPVEFSESDASIHRYSLVFKRRSTSTEDFIEASLAGSDNIIIYPNPANDLLHVRVLNGSGKLSYQIYSMTGVKVLEGSLENSQKININTLQPGIYIIDAGGQKVKFVKD